MWKIITCLFFYWPGLEVVHITSTGIDLTGHQSHYPTWMQSRLRNIVFNLPVLSWQWFRTKEGSMSLWWKTNHTYRMLPLLLPVYPAFWTRAQYPFPRGKIQCSLYSLHLYHPRGRISHYLLTLIQWEKCLQELFDLQSFVEETKGILYPTWTEFLFRSYDLLKFETLTLLGNLSFFSPEQKALKFLTNGLLSKVFSITSPLPINIL